MLTLDESSHVADVEYGVGGKNKVTRVTWFSFATLQLLTTDVIIEAGNIHQFYTSIIINSNSGMDLYSVPITAYKLQ